MLALTSNPVPGVKNTIPRVEFLLKKFAGNRFGAEKASGTASQLISRWPVADGGPAMLLGLPKKFLKAFTVFRISFAVAPDASKTCGAAEAANGFKTSVKPKLAIASKSQCLARGANVRVVPRRLVIEWVIDCMDCIVLVDVEGCFLFWFFSACLLFVPVHVIKRKGRLKPATTAQFFWITSGCAVKIPRSC